MPTATKSRIWGTWDTSFYLSGTTIVRCKENKPWLYVEADSAIDEDRYMSDRYEMCYQLAEYLNGGPRPAWLDDLERQNEVKAVSLYGASITATGPMIDTDPPNLRWEEDKSDAAVNDRARLMDVVFTTAQLTE